VTWSENNITNEKLKFVARMIKGEKIPVLYREFGISSRHKL
jgi:hypothetical protein